MLSCAAYRTSNKISHANADAVVEEAINADVVEVGMRNGSPQGVFEARAVKEKEKKIKNRFKTRRGG